MKKLWIPIVSLLLFFLPQAAFAQSSASIEQKCEYTLQEGINPPYQVVNCLLTETALAYDIPPEVVKAIAAKESGHWKQFDEKTGKAIETNDGGIGLMQVTNHPGYDDNELRTNILYNIKAGVEILDSMFTTRKDLPAIGNQSRDVIEHWYFAIMAYNGIKPVNSPVVSATGERNAEAYQEKVFKIIEDHNLLNLTRVPFKNSDFEYDTEGRENIKFLTKNYQVDEPMHTSKHHFQTGDSVYLTTNSVSLRKDATTESNRLAYLSKNEKVEITGPFVYDKSTVKEKPNHFVWYPIKRENGTIGYVASSYLEAKNIQTGWVYDNGNWYYFNDSGMMKTGWVLDTDNKWYYMNSSGIMQTGWVYTGGQWYYLASSGAMQTGWELVQGKWYYMNSSGAMQTGWELVEGKWYYMNSSGAMQTGWFLDGGKWYYMNSSGAMQTDWVLDKGKWYYMNSSGAMQTGTVKIGGKTYKFTSSGVWIN